MTPPSNNSGMQQQQEDDLSNRMIPREVMQIELLKQQLHQTRLDMTNLSERLLATDRRLDKSDDKLQGILDKLNEIKGGRAALIGAVTVASMLSGVVVTLAQHWRP